MKKLIIILTMLFVTGLCKAQINIIKLKDTNVIVMNYDPIPIGSSSNVAIGKPAYEAYLREKENNLDSVIKSLQKRIEALEQRFKVNANVHYVNSTYLNNPK